MMNIEEPDQGSGGSPPLMPEPPKFLDNLLREMEREGSLPDGATRNSPGVPDKSEPIMARIAGRGKLRKSRLLITVLLAAIAVNIVLIIMMVSVLKGRPSSEVADTSPVTDEAPEAKVEELPRKPGVIPAPGKPQESAATELDQRVVVEAEPPPAVILPLAISKLALCREVKGFGDYDLIPDDPLRPHHVPQIQAYIEIANPRPESRDDDRFVYYMTVAMRLYPSGDPFAEPLIDKAVSLVVNGTSPREDFHAAQPLQVNRRVGPGDYTLLVRVTDQISGETARMETRFRVHASQP